MLTPAQARWLDHDGTAITLDVYVHTLKVDTYEVIYPYAHTVLRVHAQPQYTETKWYKAMKRQLGDDWSTDVLGSDIDVQLDVMQQLGMIH